jgi:MFS family permease
LNRQSAFFRLDLQGYVDTASRFLPTAHLPLSYIGTTYLLTSTVFLPIFASVADIYGRYWGIQVSLFFFIIGSAISTGAQSMEMLILGRGVAGIGAAGMLIVSEQIFLWYQQHIWVEQLSSRLSGLF